MAIGAGASTVVKVPQLLWWEESEVMLTFPGQYDVTVCDMAGKDAPRLSPEGFEKALADPIGSRPLRELARGKRDAVIVFDDISRPTRVGEIASYVLRDLVAAGVEERNIQFICALGCHGAHSALEFSKKLGTDIVANFDVYNHNPYENCAPIGKTSRGTPVVLNAEFLKADLKIGIGTIMPHPMAGFGGGPKIILPGVASMETIHYNHLEVWRAARKSGVQAKMTRGSLEENALFHDMVETCLMSGLDFKIDSVLNLKCETVALFAGKPVEQFYEGVKLARKHYLTPAPEKPDVVVLNANSKINEASVGMSLGEPFLPESGGTMVVLSNNPWGEAPHYLLRSFGAHMGGMLYRPPRLSPRVKKLIVQMPYKVKTSTDWMGPADAVSWARTWEEVLDLLHEEHPNGARVAVVPDATMQLF